MMEQLYVPDSTYDNYYSHGPTSLSCQTSYGMNNNNQNQRNNHNINSRRMSNFKKGECSNDFISTPSKLHLMPSPRYSSSILAPAESPHVNYSEYISQAMANNGCNNMPRVIPSSQPYRSGGSEDNGAPNFKNYNNSSYLTVPSLDPPSNNESVHRSVTADSVQSQRAYYPTYNSVVSSSMLPQHQQHLQQPYYSQSQSKSSNLINYQSGNNSYSPTLEEKTDEQKYSKGRWKPAEHEMFLQGLDLYGKNWKTISKLIGTRSAVQTRTHAQKYFIKLRKEREADSVQHRSTAPNVITRKLPYNLYSTASNTDVIQANKKLENLLATSTDKSIEDLLLKSNNNSDNYDDNNNDTTTTSSPQREIRPAASSISSDKHSTIPELKYDSNETNTPDPFDSSIHDDADALMLLLSASEQR